jgi:hypothetical protein
MKMLKEPCRFRFRSPNKTEHPRYQPPTDGRLKKSTVLIPKQFVILRRQLPSNPFTRPKKIQGSKPDDPQAKDQLQ